MAASANVTLNGTVSGLPSGSLSIGPTAITSAAAVGRNTNVDLASGDNTVTIPSGTSLIVIVPPSGNAANLTIKGASGDTGIPIHPTNWSAWSPRSTATSFILNASATANGTTVVFV